MDDQPNLREFLNEVSSFSEEAPAAPKRFGKRRRWRRSAKSSKSPARARRSAWTRRCWPRFSRTCRPVGRHVRPGRQPGQDDRRQQLADRQRPHACAPATTASIVAHVDFLGEGTKRFERQDEQLPPRRHPLSDPGLPRCFPVTHRGPARDLRRQRRAAHRDRHRLSDRRHPRRALRRPDARQAFRGAGIDRYRQIDLGRADPPPHLAAQRPRVTS